MKILNFVRFAKMEVHSVHVSCVQYIRSFFTLILNTLLKMSSVSTAKTSTEANHVFFAVVRGLGFKFVDFGF